MLELRQIFNRGDFTDGYLYGNPGDDLLSGSSPKNQGIYLGRIVAVVDSENKAQDRDEKAAVRGALRRGKVLACVALDRHSPVGIEPGDGLEFRHDDGDYLVSPPIGSVTTYIKEVGERIILVGDFDRGIETGDLAFKVTDRKLIDEALDAPDKKLPVTMLFTARAGQFPRLVMTDVRADETVEIVADHVIERAQKVATDASRIADNLSRLGDTPYTPGMTGIDVEIDDDIMMPLSIVNRMRREASEELMKRRGDSVTSGRAPRLTRAELDVAESAELLGAAVLDADEYAKSIRKRAVKPVPLENFMKMRGEGAADVIPYILNVSRGSLDAYIRENFDEIAGAVRDTGILIGNLGWIRQFREAGIKVYGDYGLNVFNEQAKRAFEDEGVELYMPSHETGIMDERGIPLMITEHPVQAETLTDRKGEVHRIERAASGDKTLIY
jgi:putative protease